MGGRMRVSVPWLARSLPFFHRAPSCFTLPPHPPTPGPPGMDWDELEKEAAREDKAHHHSEDEDDERPRKRKGEGGAAAGSKRGRH